MVLIVLVYGPGYRQCLLVTVRDLDDCSSAVRLASMASSRLRTVRIHRLGRDDLGRNNHLALAHGQVSPNFRVGDQHPRRSC
jgi:hypothetical protein